MPDLHLAAGAAAGADADGGHAEPRRDLGGDGRRHHLQHDGEAARLLERVSVEQELRRRRRRPPLDLVAAEGGERLRREPDVADDGDAGVDGGAHHRDGAAAALDLHSVHPALLEQAHRVARGVGRGEARAKGEVADHHRLDAAACGAAVVDHLVHRDRRRVLLPEHHHADRVADEHGVDAGAVGEPRRRAVVRRHHRDRLAALAHRLQRRDAHLRPRLRRRVLLL